MGAESSVETQNCDEGMINSGKGREV